MTTYICKNGSIKYFNKNLHWLCTYFIHPFTHSLVLSFKMILHVDFDASYQVAARAKSQNCWIFPTYLHTTPQNSSTPANGPILIECKTLHNVIAFFTGSEKVALFYNVQITLPIPYMLYHGPRPTSKSFLSTQHNNRKFHKE